MAQSISIGAVRHPDVIKSCLFRELKHFEDKGMKVRLEENPAGKFTFFSCRVTDTGRYPADGENVFKQQMADILSDLILGQWEKFLLWDLIRENYYYFSEEERRDIFHFASRYVGHEDDGRGVVYRLRRRSRVRKKIHEFLGQNNQIVIDGFIRFRLKEYVDELQEAVDRAVDDFLLEREYREFIQLLKYFVEIQEPRQELVHVLLLPGGGFELLDEHEQAIKSDYLESFVLDVMQNEINYEDMLVSALITLAPGRIIFHRGEGELQDNTVLTIKNVFSGRVNECPGCRLCKK